MPLFRFGPVAILLGCLLPSQSHADTAIFSSDFNSAIPAAITPGAAALTGVQGFAGLGPPSSQFGGMFLRSPTGNVVTLTLSGLPSHASIGLDFLFAAIDSLDGTGTFPQGDFFKVTLDGVQVFRESFANAIASQIQSYVPPPGVQLARRVNLGFSVGDYFLDSAYDLGADPAFQHLSHSASTAIVTFQMEGPGIQPLTDESWAVDNLRVTVAGSCPGDFNHDGLVDDLDFSIFVVAYDTLDCADPGMPAGCPADLNGDHLVDDSDFVIFAAAYDALVCP